MIDLRKLCEEAREEHAHLWIAKSVCPVCALIDKIPLLLKIAEAAIPLRKKMIIEGRVSEMAPEWFGFIDALDKLKEG